jgi:hypothetical protein
MQPCSQPASQPASHESSLDALSRSVERPPSSLFVEEGCSDGNHVFCTQPAILYDTLPNQREEGACSDGLMYSFVVAVTVTQITTM